MIRAASSFLMLLMTMLVAQCANKDLCKDLESRKVPESAIIGELIVGLKTVESVKTLEVEFESISLKQKEVISSHNRLVLYTYDPESIRAEYVLSLLEKSELVSMAEFNKTLGIRK